VCPVLLAVLGAAGCAEEVLLPEGGGPG